MCALEISDLPFVASTEMGLRRQMHGSDNGRSVCPVKVVP